MDLRRCLVAIGVMLGAWVGVAPMGQADIRTTPHGKIAGDAVKDTKEICVFCHTPAISTQMDAVAAPLWQKSLGDGYVFVMYDDIGRLQYGDKPAVGSQSLACLSCHDATQAYSVSNNFAMDHPYGVPYRGYLREHKSAEKVVSTVAEDEEGAVKAKYLKSVDDFRRPSSGIVDNRTVWWVSGSEGSMVRQRGDLPLYVRKGEGNDEGVPYMECSSCHDPHIDNGQFLRITNTGSRLCLTCHDK